jgi:hypothetical protein
MSRVTLFDLDCPTCGRPLRIRVNLLGKIVKCGHCRGEFNATPEAAHKNRGDARLLPKASLLPTGDSLAPPASTPPASSGERGKGVDLEQVERLLLAAEQFLAE